MKLSKVIPLVIIAAVLILFYSMGWQSYFRLSFVQENLSTLRKLVSEYGFWSYGLYFLLYFAGVAAFLPVAAILTLLAGAIFPLWAAVLLVSFASTLGATANAFVARYMLRGSLEQRYRTQLNTINKNLNRNGISYLFTLRLLPIFPFFVINLVFGLTRMKLWNFLWVSQLGTLAGTIVYVNAGHNLGQIHQLRDIVSAPILFSFVLLGLLPYIAKLLISCVKHLAFFAPLSPPPPF